MKKTASLFAILAFLLTDPALQAATSTVTVNMQAEVPVSIQLSVSPEGQSELKFGNIQPVASQVTQAGPVTVAVKVDTNSGQKYQVTQTANGALQNADGDTISAESLKFMSSALNAGVTTVSSLTPVSGLNQTIYVSNELGEGDTISADYTLTVPPNQPAGDYSTLLTYTASTI